MKTWNMLKTLFIAVFLMSVLALYAGPVSQNLLANPSFESGFNNWAKTDGGNGWYLNTNFGRTGNQSIVSSHQWCTVTQSVDLLAAGFTEEELDSGSFTIDYHTWITSGWGGNYYITVEARNSSNAVVASSNIGTALSPIVFYDISYWQRIIKQHGSRFTVSSTGVRYINIVLGGKDNRSWAGHYGTLFDDIYVGINNSFDAPQVSTTAVTNITFDSATGNGSTIDLGIDNPTQYGHCWNTTGMPTIDDSKTSLGSTPRLFDYQSTITGLSPHTEYFVRAYATNSAGTEYGEQLSFTTSITTNYLSPLDEEEGTSITPELMWEPVRVAPEGYRLYVGTDNPPTNVLHAVDLGNQTNYNLDTLMYNQTYFWRIEAYIGANSAMGDVYSFTTTNTYTAEPGSVPGAEDIEPEIYIPLVSGEFYPDIYTQWNPDGTPYDNAGLLITVSGVSMTGRTLIINPDLGFIPSGIAFRIRPSESWIYQAAAHDWRTDYVYFTVPGAKLDGDLDVLFPISGDDTLPVTLSSFTANYFAQSSYVTLNWVVQSETDCMGYNLLRGESDDLIDAIRVNNQMVTQGTSNGTMISYSWQDMDVCQNGTYYYWLEYVALNGASQYYGPITVYVNADGEGPGIPEIPIETKLFAAFPNPFNPATNLRYSMKEAGDVRIDIYNVKGQILTTYHNSHNQPGYYQLNWDGRDQNGRPVSTGVYFYRMTSGKYISTKKMVMAK